MKYLIGILISLYFLLTSCSKEKIDHSPPLDYVIHRISDSLISGGGSVSFERIFGHGTSFRSGKQTSDGGYILFGYTEIDVAFKNDALLLKTNSLGEIVWYKRYYDRASDEGQTVNINSDNGYILTFNYQPLTKYPINYRNSGMIVRTDSLGNELWRKSIKLSGSTHMGNAIQTLDGGFLVLAADYTSGHSDLIKFDSNGNEIWRKTFTSTFLSNFSIASNGDIILVGRRISHAKSDCNIIKTNSIGNIIWDSVYSETLSTFLTSVKETPTGDIITCGWSGFGLTSTVDEGISKLVDKNGNQLWHSNFSSINIGRLYSIQPTNDNQFISVGTSMQTNPYQASDGVLLKIDGNGNSQWVNIHSPGYSTTDLYEVHQTADNGYMAVGGYPYGSSYGYLVKTDFLGN